MIGGAVRDNLLGIKSQDIDLASTALPEVVMEKLKAAGIDVKPTGIDFGTVTAILDHQPYEITTLREDMECDGRHAKVTYSTDWEKDAARRDFTINAMSVDMQGNLHDYFGGQADLKAGILRFVGVPDERIREDYLRILRLFRFYAYFGKTPIDAVTLAACSAGKGGIAGLSAERVQKEMLKLLAAPKPHAALAAMQDCGVLPCVLPSSERLSALPKLQQVEHENDIAADPLRRLALLLQPEHLLGISKDWKLSRKATAGLKARLECIGQYPSVSIFRLARLHGKDAVRDALLCHHVLEGQDIADALKQLVTFTIPVLPVGGGDIMEHFPEAKGEVIGVYLKQAEDFWEAENYQPSKAEILTHLRKNPQ